MTKDDVLFGYRQQLFAEAARTSVSAACRTFGVHRSTYCYWEAPGRPVEMDIGYVEDLDGHVLGPCCREWSTYPNSVIRCFAVRFARDESGLAKPT
jgi:hypothetical protein